MARRARPERRRPPRPPPERALLRIERLGADGDGVAVHEGRLVFAALAAPGDLVDCEIEGDRARILRWIEASPDRREPPCPHFGRCGGCALQHFSREYGAEWKRRRVAEELARAGLGGAPVKKAEPIAPATRRRATFAVSVRDGWRLGFNARRSAEIVEVPECAVLHPAITAKLVALRNLARRFAAPSFDLAVTVCANGLDVNAAGRSVREPTGEAFSALAEAARAAGCVRLSVNGAPILQTAEPLIDFDGLFVAPPPGGFLQASREGEDILRGLVREAVGDSRRVLDLFCGSGTFALPLARRASVHAVDGDASAVAALTAAAAGAQRSGESLLEISAETRDLFSSPIGREALDAFDALVFDPPRAGAKDQTAEIARSRVPAVVAVSCNPRSFARDAAILAEGGYRLAETTVVDQFVYSPHIEAVGVFRKRG